MIREPKHCSICLRKCILGIDLNIITIEDLNLQEAIKLLFMPRQGASGCALVVTDGWIVIGLKFKAYLTIKIKLTIMKKNGFSRNKN